MPYPKKDKKVRKTNDAGRELLAGVRQMHEAVTTGSLTGFKVNQISVPEPSEYEAADVRALRDSLNLTQALFARVVGVSTETVEHWEQGLRHPAASARRLMDQIRSRPDSFLFWLLRNLPAPASSHLAADDATKDRAKAMLRLAARVLSRREMVEAVREAYA
jgi:putative transcriptional regulator